MKKKLVLIDGNSVAYRAFFALPLLHNDKGIHTNAVYGFTMMLMKILEESGVCTKSDFRNAVKNGTYDFDFVAEISVGKE